MTPAERTALLAVAAHVLDRVQAAGLETDDRPRRWLEALRCGERDLRVWWWAEQWLRHRRRVRHPSEPIVDVAAIVLWTVLDRRFEALDKADYALVRMGEPDAAARAQIDLLYARELERARGAA